ncbi:krueppel like ous 1 [Fusarium phyllophilum]|uniref:Krueppel like ous 1 n=1 Tax=Fusarium phyllophilum TaxID=47803 RepID=A0A8H5JE39_9HYPO|nr:krueppel like ous 1 [Fusarium phyllophilum]
MTNPDFVNAIAFQQHKGTDRAWVKRALEAFPNADSLRTIEGPWDREIPRIRDDELSPASEIQSGTSSANCMPGPSKLPKSSVLSRPPQPRVSTANNASAPGSHMGIRRLVALLFSSSRKVNLWSGYPAQRTSSSEKTVKSAVTEVLIPPKAPNNIGNFRSDVKRSGDTSSGQTNKATSMAFPNEPQKPDGNQQQTITRGNDAQEDTHHSKDNTEQIEEIDQSQSGIALTNELYVEHLIKKREDDSRLAGSNDHAQYVPVDDDDATTVIPTESATVDDNGWFRIGIQPVKLYKIDIRSLPNEMASTWVKRTVRFQYRTSDRVLPSPDEDCLSRTEIYLNMALNRWFIQEKSGYRKDLCDYTGYELSWTAGHRNASLEAICLLASTTGQIGYHVMPNVAVVMASLNTIKRKHTPIILPLLSSWLHAIELKHFETRKSRVTWLCNSINNEHIIGKDQCRRAEKPAIQYLQDLGR